MWGRGEYRVHASARQDGRIQSENVDRGDEESDPGPGKGEGGGPRTGRCESVVSRANSAGKP